MLRLITYWARCGKSKPWLEKAIASYKKAAELYLDQQEVANCRRCLERIRQLSPTPVVRSGPPPLSAAEFLQQALQKAKLNGYPSAIEGDG